MQVIEQDCDNNLDSIKPYENFLFALKSSEVKRQYPKLLKIFLDNIKFELDKESIAERANLLYEKSISPNKKWLETQIIRFVAFQKERVEKKEIAAGTLKNYVKVVKLFCEMNEIENLIHWKKIKIGMPKVKEQADDRAPTMDEIRKLLEYPDLRIKPIVLTMISSGMRVGAWDYLKWKHIIPLKDKNDDIIAAKIIIYAGEPEQYYSFITKEAYQSLNDWMNYRSSFGENVTRDSWLMRDIWQKTHKRYSHRIGLATNPKQLKSTGIKGMISSMWQVVGVRTELAIGQKRHEFKGVHGFRKFFESNCQLVMNHNNIKMLMDHSLGESGNYHRPTEKQLLDDYLKASDYLTSSEENKLKKKNKELENKLNNREKLLNEQLVEKEKRLQIIEEKYDNEMKNMKEEMNEQFTQVMKLVQQDKKLSQIKPTSIIEKINDS